MIPPILSDSECLEIGFDRAAFMLTPASHSGDREGLTYVYVLQCGEYVKVGVAVDVHSRVEALQAGNPYPITVAVKLPLESKLNALLCERTIHSCLSAYAHQREWFKCPADHAAKVATAVHEACREIRAKHLAEARDRLRRKREGARARTEERIARNLARKRALTGETNA